MASNNSDQLNNENAKPSEGENNQQNVAGTGEEPVKSAKQLAKEAEKAEKLKKFQEKQKAKALAEEQVNFFSNSKTKD